MMLNLNTMKRTLQYIMLACCTGLLFSACSEDFLDKDPLVDNVIENFYKTGNDAVLAVNAAYVPMAWEFNDTYYCEWMLGDIVSDDALKGGNGISDMTSLYQLENFKVTPSNELLLEFYRAQYQGIYRCNLAIHYIPDIPLDSAMDQSMKNRLLGEVHFLRAYYYFRLVRVFGGVPKVTTILDPSEYKQPRAEKDTIYDLIFSDLKEAIPGLWLKSQYPVADMGRVTKGAAEALLMKAYLYNNRWQETKTWGDSVISSHEYNLVSNYFQNFTLEGENGPESVFEIQYMEEPTSDYGDGNGYTRGTFTVILQRTRVGSLGWGFNRPTMNLISEYETGDLRRTATITGPDADLYLGNGYHSKKYALDGYTLAHATRGPLNYKVIRYADVLLMYAEAACELDQTGVAKEALEEIRVRARGTNASVLPAFPYGSYSDNQSDLRKAIRHERRVELALEGQRFFDLQRWGIAATVMNAYRDQESAEVKAQMDPFVENKHELFPIPEVEINLSQHLLTQNPNY